MCTLEIIEKLYKKWDGTTEHAAEILRYIHLVMQREKNRNENDSELMDYLTE